MFKSGVLCCAEIVIDEDDDDDDASQTLRAGALLVRRGGCGRAPLQADAGRTQYAGQGG